MTRLYALHTWVCYILVATQLYAQTSADLVNYTLTSNSVGNVIFTTSDPGSVEGSRHAIWTLGDGYCGQETGPLERIFKYKAVELDNLEDSCKVDFKSESATGSNDQRITYFKAFPWNNNNQKPSRICWNFGDGKDTCVNYGQDYTGNYIVRHVYQHAARYEVCVKVLYYGGCETYNCKAVEPDIHVDSCKVDFESESASGSNDQRITYFKALPWHPNNKKPSRICWSYGDGTDTCVNYGQDYTGNYIVRHVYQHAARYEVCVKVLYYGGCETYNCKAVGPDIHVDSCKVDFKSESATGSNDQRITYFKALPWNNNNQKPSRICWNFGDGKDTCVNYGQDYTGNYIVRHVYQHAARYEVCVKILYYGGCETYKCKAVEPGNIADSCKVDFKSESAAGSNDQRITYFKAFPWNNNNQKPSRICWNFGDGKDTCVNYGQDYTGNYIVRHVYQHAARYEVCVKVLYYGGCETYNCKTVEPGNRADSCKVDFESESATGSNDQRITYFKAFPWNNNNQKPSRICWNFGDGKDTRVNYGQDYTGNYIVRHVYQHAARYEVCVKVLYYGGCETYNCKAIEPGNRADSCKVDFESESATGSNDQRITYFKALPWHNNNKKPSRICWNFGDGKDTCISYGQDYNGTYGIAHIYRENGEYQVCSRIIYNGGCTSYDCEDVVVENKNTGVCGGYFTDSLISVGKFRFKAYPVHSPNDAVIAYRWTFGDGSSASGREVAHIYNVPGEYRVCLNILTRTGCETSICNTVRITVNDAPKMLLKPNPVHNVVYVMFYSTNTENVHIQVIDMRGVAVMSFTLHAIAGINNWNFDTSGLLPGYYILVVQSPNQLTRATFLKQ